MLARMKIGPRLTIGFAVIVALMSCVAVIAVMGLHSLNGDLKRIVESRHAKTEHLHTMLEEINAVSIAVRTALLAQDEAGRAPHLTRVAAGREALSGMLAKLDGFQPEDDKSKALQQAVQDDNAAYTIEIVKVSRALKANKTEMAANFMHAGLQPKFEKYMATLRALNEYEAELMRRAQQNAAGSYENGRLWIGGMLVLAVLMTAVLAFVLTRSIVRPLRGAGELAAAIAEGKLSTRIEIAGRDETASLLRSLETMQSRLAGILSDVKVASDAINTASSEIAAGNADLSHRTEQQAASLERTSSSMEELAGTVRENASNAVQANQLAAEASQVAIKGGAVVGEVVQTMSSIQDSSKKIADIITVIDGIAFQTNILALNAAVEAARAGEMGRGFAVVATEVRTLAQRSAGAAKEIKALIGDSVAKVANGTQLVDEAGRTMSEIVASVQRVTDIMGNIAHASQDQTVRIGHVNDAVSAMDEMTQQNAALVEEAAAAAESMQEQAHQLQREVSVFDLGAPEARAAAHAERPAQPAAAVGQPRSKIARLFARLFRRGRSAARQDRSPRSAAVAQMPRREPNAVSAIPMEHAPARAHGG